MKLVISLPVSLHEKKFFLNVQYRLANDIATKSLPTKRRSPVAFEEDQVAVVAILIRGTIILCSSLCVKEPDDRSGNKTPNLTVEVRHTQMTQLPHRSHHSCMKMQYERLSRKGIGLMLWVRVRQNPRIRLGRDVDVKKGKNGDG